MSSSNPATELHKVLETAEEQTQDYLVRRPPALFVQRTLSLINVPEDERLSLLRSIFPTADSPNALALAALGDSAVFTQRDDVACLNRYFYADLGELRESITQQVRRLLHDARGGMDKSLVYGCTELLGYLLVEQCYWEFISQPLVTLRFNQATISEAGELLDSALLVAKERRDWLRWHRILANQARIGYLAQDQSKALALKFDSALGVGQLCLDHGYPVDRAFPLRRDELLHMAGVVKFVKTDLTYPNLCAHIKSPARIKPPPGGVRLTVESRGLIANMSMPLLVSVQEATRQSSEHTAYVDWLSLEDRVQVWMTYKGRHTGQALGYRDLHGLDNLDLVFRPNQFEVNLRMKDSLMGREELDGEEKGSMEGQRAKADHMAYMRPDLGGDQDLGSEVVEGMRWDLRFPMLEMGLDQNGRPYHTTYSPDMAGIPWERSLGMVLGKLLPDDKDLEHLVVSTDGPLALLPFHLAILPGGRLLTDRYRVSYAPSLVYLSPAPASIGAQGSRIAVLVNTRNRLQGPIWELGRLKGRL